MERPESPSSGRWTHPGLGVRRLAGRGRGLVATTPLPAGTLLFTEPPMATVPASPQGKAEDKDDEETVTSSAALAVAVLLATPVALRRCWDGGDRRAEEPSLSALHSLEARLRLAASLPTHGESIGDAAFRGLYRTAKAMLRRAAPGLGESRRDRHRLRRILLVVWSNSFALDRASELGRGFYPGAALLNHSCRPNALISFGEDSLLRLRLVRPVTAGEEICANYGVDVAGQTTVERAEALADWRFVCRCPEACQSESSAGWRPPSTAGAAASALMEHHFPRQSATGRWPTSSARWRRLAPSRPASARPWTRSGSPARPAGRWTCCRAESWSGCSGATPLCSARRGRSQSPSRRSSPVCTR